MKSKSDDKINIYALPKGWVWVKLGEVAEIISGVSFKPEQLCKHDVENVRILRGGNIQNDDYFLLEDDYFVPKNIVSDDQLLRKYDIILVSSTGSKQAIGKAAIIKEELNNLSVGAFLRIIRIYENIQKKYIGFYFYTLSYRNYIREIVKGVNINNIKDSYLNEMVIPLPPLTEQHRIVAKIEELFTKLDAGVDALKKAKEQIKRYRQAVLKYAFEGKLTEEWREANMDKLESASVLLEQIKEERKKKLGKKYRELSPVDTSELPELPEGWIWVRIGNVIEPSDKKIDPLKLENKPYIGLEHIEKDTGKLLGYGQSSEIRSTKSLFYKGDLLYGKLRPYLNKVCVVDFDGVCSTDILVFSKSPYISNKYMAYRFLCKDFVRFANQNISGVQHPRTNYNVLSQFIIPLPPLTEQQKIVEEIERRFSVTDEVEKAIDNSLKQAERLRQSILKKAFEGKLVPQDPNDEPADKLLERVRKSLQL